MTAPTIAPQTPGGEWTWARLCLCGSSVAGHTCAYTRGEGWCPRCLADHDDPECCTPQRLARLVTARSQTCGCLPGDACRHGGDR